jgi:cation transport protein ChaC
MTLRVELTRDSILSGSARAQLNIDPKMLWSDEQVLGSLQATLQDAPPGDVWLFAYGSLMWNPCIEPTAMVPLVVAGWHRRYCLWTTGGRGTPEAPGLMLGLERGGKVAGMALKIPLDRAASDLEVVFRREMITGSYTPRWVHGRSPDGPITAIGFTINRAHPRYANHLPDEEVARIVAAATGPLGSCLDYLLETERRLAGLGLSDRRLSRISRAVRVLQGS